MSAMKSCDNENFIPSPPMYTGAQIGDNYVHAWTAETKPFLLLRLFDLGNEASHDGSAIVDMVLND